MSITITGTPTIRIFNLRRWIITCCVSHVIDDSTFCIHICLLWNVDKIRNLILGQQVRGVITWYFFLIHENLSLIHGDKKHWKKASIYQKNDIALPPMLPPIEIVFPWLWWWGWPSPWTGRRAQCWLPMHLFATPRTCYAFHRWPYGYPPWYLYTVCTVYSVPWSLCFMVCCLLPTEWWMRRSK